MLNTVYQLVRPRQFEITFRDLSLDKEKILVRPTHLSICNADQRYYQGKRPECHRAISDSSNSITVTPATC